MMEGGNLSIYHYIPLETQDIHYIAYMVMVLPVLSNRILLIFGRCFEELEGFSGGGARTAACNLSIGCAGVRLSFKWVLLHL